MTINVLVTSPICEDKFGGPVQVIHDHLSYLNSIGSIGVNLLGVVDDVENYSSQISDFPHKFVKRQRPLSWSYSKEFNNSITKLLRQNDVVHTHMLWDYTTLSTFRASNKSLTPMIVTPHGSISGRRGDNSLKKKLYKISLLSRMLKKVPVIQALTANEAYDIRKFGFKGEIEVIPNGVSKQFISCSPYASYNIRNTLGLKNERVALYMGRLWEGKGLKELFDAWSKLLFEDKVGDWVLLIVGPDYRGFQNILERKINAYNLNDRIRVVGPIYGKEKLEALDLCELFILPSHEEAFSMSILEAAARGKPVIYTQQCNFPELSAVGGGWEIPNSSKALHEILFEILKRSEKNLEICGEKGKRLIGERYTQEVVGEALIALYNRLAS